MEPMVDAVGHSRSQRKWEVDAEGLAVKDGVATVGFERNHRIAQFRIDPDDMKAAVQRTGFPGAGSASCARTAASRRSPTPIRTASTRAGWSIVSEKSLDKARQHLRRHHRRAATRASSRSGATASSTSPTAPSCRTATCCCSSAASRWPTGVKMRLRRIYGESIAKGEVADGPVLFEADMGYQIDNMEGLDVWTRDDGAQMVSLISDDNHSILQRNLYLEFVLHED